MTYCGRCRQEIVVGDRVTRVEVGLVYESVEGDKCSETDGHAVFLQHRGSCAERVVEGHSAGEEVATQVRTYRLNVSGTVKFTDEDKELEELLLASLTSPQQTEQFGVRLSRAIQSLEEEATELFVVMTRI